jgi:hypothetical protein
MFRMKYLINRMQCNTLSQKFGGLMVGLFASILKVKGWNFTNRVFVINSGKLTEYFPM